MVGVFCVVYVVQETEMVVFFINVNQATPGLQWLRTFLIILLLWNLSGDQVTDNF